MINVRCTTSISFSYQIIARRNLVFNIHACIHNGVCTDHWGDREWSEIPKKICSRVLVNGIRSYTRLCGCLKRKWRITLISKGDRTEIRDRDIV